MSGCSEILGRVRSFSHIRQSSFRPAGVSEKQEAAAPSPEGRSDGEASDTEPVEALKTDAGTGQ